jgi:hypothetical protein
VRHLTVYYTVMSHTLQALQPFVMHVLPPTRAVRLTEVTMESAKVCLQLTTTAVAAGCPRCAGFCRKVAFSRVWESVSH